MESAAICSVLWPPLIPHSVRDPVLGHLLSRDLCVSCLSSCPPTGVQVSLCPSRSSNVPVPLPALWQLSSSDFSTPWQAAYPAQLRVTDTGARVTSHGGPRASPRTGGAARQKAQQMSALLVFTGHNITWHHQRHGQCWGISSPGAPGWPCTHLERP